MYINLKSSKLIAMSNQQNKVISRLHIILGFFFMLNEMKGTLVYNISLFVG